MITPELRNIQSLFASDCLENHILGFVLFNAYKRSLQNDGVFYSRNYQELFYLIINDRNGWVGDEYISKLKKKKIFNMWFIIHGENYNLNFSFEEYFNRYKCYTINKVFKPLTETEFYKLFEDNFLDEIDKHCRDVFV